MYKFTKDFQRCVGCGNCTLYGETFLKCKNVYELRMDEDFITNNKKEIELLLDKCFLEALSLQEYKEI